jgi:hypothetical protein
MARAQVAIAARVQMATTPGKTPIYREKGRCRVLGLLVNSIPSLSFKLTRFVRILQRGFLLRSVFLFLHFGVESGSVSTASGFSACEQRGHEIAMGLGRRRWHNGLGSGRLG